VERALTALRRKRFAAAVVAVVVLAAAAWAGAFASGAAAATDAAQIDAFLAQHESPMVGAGATFVAEGRAHGVNPVFLVAIAGAESSFGCYLYSEAGDQCTFNAFNWFYGPSRTTSDFSSWEAAIARVAEGLAGDLYYGAGLCSVDAIAPKYCPDGTAEWIANVKAFMSELGGDPADTRIAVSAPSSPPTGPGIVALEGSVELDRGDRIVGQRVYAWFTLKNAGGEPIDLDGIRLAIRGPGDSDCDLVSSEPLTLQPGQKTEVSASWPLDLAGRWRGWIEVTQDGRASLVGEPRAFGFRVRLPHKLEMRRLVLRDAALTQAL